MAGREVPRDCYQAPLSGEEKLAALAGMLIVASELVRDEPSARRIEELCDAGLFDCIAGDYDDEALERGLQLLYEDAAVVIADETGAKEQELKREWLRLFPGVGQAQAPTWAGFYLDPESHVLSEESLAVRALYAKYGLVVEAKGAEPDDELGLMLRFLVHLVSLGLGGESTKADQAELLRRHILPWISAWHYAGLKHALSAYYRGVVEFTFGAIRVFAATLGFDYREITSSFVQKG